MRSPRARLCLWHQRTQQADRPDSGCPHSPQEGERAKANSAAIKREDERRPRHAVFEGRNGRAARGEHGGEEVLAVVKKVRSGHGVWKPASSEGRVLNDVARAPLMDPNYNFGITGKMVGGCWRTMRAVVAGTGPLTARDRDEQNAVSSEGGHQAGLWTSRPKLGSRSKTKRSCSLRLGKNNCRSLLSK